MKYNNFEVFSRPKKSAFSTHPKLLFKKTTKIDTNKKSIDNQSVFQIRNVSIVHQVAFNRSMSLTYKLYISDI